MKWLRLLTVVAATLGLNSDVQAGITERLGLNDGCCKSCAPAPSCQPQCCKPTITRPCDRTVHTYQRKLSTQKPPCCNKCCAPTKCCAPAPKCCSPAGNKAAGIPSPLPGIQSVSVNLVGSGCCQPKSCCPKPKCCPKSCCEKQCCADPCEIAELIYQSQTACYARQRRRALDKLGDKFDCVCNPEIMDALVYGLNDADEKVRAEAADEIGDQIRKSGQCCCNDKVVAALKAALADCDWRVRRQAEEGLEACGYCLVDGCCPKPCCKSSCCGSGGGSPAPAEGKPAPAPPAASKAYIPVNRMKTSSRLASLFGLLD
jgi:hypothetical protein